MNTLHKLFATGLGTGYSPVAPGTVGSAVACGFLYLMRVAGPARGLETWSWNLLLVVVTGLIFVAGLRSSEKMEAEYGADPSCVVIDEWVGMWVSMILVPITWIHLLAGFLLFRLFDIWKPLWINRAEKLRGGWGIMMDDVVAGVAANMVLQAVSMTGFFISAERFL